VEGKEAVLLIQRHVSRNETTVRGQIRIKEDFILFLSSLTKLLTCIGPDSSNKILTIHLAPSRGVLNTVNFVCNTKTNSIPSVKNMERSNAYSNSPNIILIKSVFCRNTFILVKGGGPLYL
jgi:hypothetical protein